MTTTNDDRHKFRLIGVLRQQRERLGSYDKLSQAIHTASGVTIDRRKLKNLVGGLDVSLRISELKALDAYLAPLGEGLAAKPVFERSAILAEIAQSLEVAFILGSLPRQEFRRVDISHWDVRSMIEVMRSLNHYGRMQIDIEQAVYGKSRDQPIQNVENEAWFDRLASDRAALVCFGSPRVNPATEVMLAHMFGVEPFDVSGANQEPLPFRFVWPQDRPEFVSSFELDETDVAQADAKLATEIAGGDVNVMGLSIGGEVMPVHRKGDSWSTYGIIAAQRRSTGPIWLVLAGLDGASTFGAASDTWRFAEAIPPADKGEHSKVQWAVVETSVVIDPTLSGDQRVVGTQSMRHGPHFWSPETTPHDSMELFSI